MRYSRKKVKPKHTITRKKIFDRDVKIIVAVAVILSSIATVKIFINYKSLKQQQSLISTYEEKLNQAKNENEKLSEQISQYQDGYSDKEIAEIAKKRFHLVFPNEIIFIPRQN